jgi:uncharacterized protein (DUF58 family)
VSTLEEPTPSPAPAGSAHTEPTAAQRTPATPTDDEVLAAPTLLERVRHALGVVTVVGWSILAIAIGSWVVGWQLGWNEFMLIATACAATLLISIVFIFGRATLDVQVEVQPQRVVVGDRSAGQMTVTNASGRRLLPLRMELVVGDGAADFDVPSLAADDSHEEIFVLPTERRGIIPVGPATSVRGDPLGVLRRAVPWTQPVPLFVHPRTVPLGYLGAGLLRDLEGQPTADLSPSDIAFHALRDYEPGDDRRFIHWLTTARVGKLMVRQFTDTRRAHLAVVVDSARGSYGTPDSFEDAISCAASLGVRALSDEQELTMVVGGRRIPCISGRSMLDGLAGVDMSARALGLAAQADELLRKVTGISLAIVVTGARPTIADLRSVSLKFPVDVRTMIIRVDPEATTGFRPIGSTLVLTVASLEEFSHLLWAVSNA